MSEVIWGHFPCQQQALKREYQQGHLRFSGCVMLGYCKEGYTFQAKVCLAIYKPETSTRSDPVCGFLNEGYMII